MVIEATWQRRIRHTVCLDAIQHGKHTILIGAEIDASVGPILKTYADRAGVVFSYTDGDEPGVAMNLYRFVDSMGYRPVLMGQLKGFLDRYRNPDTQLELGHATGPEPGSPGLFRRWLEACAGSRDHGQCVWIRPESARHARLSLWPC